MIIIVYDTFGPSTLIPTQILYDCARGNLVGTSPLTGLKSDPPVPAEEFSKFRDGLSRVGQIKTDFVIS